MNDIAFKVIIKNDGIDDVIFKTLMLKGEKGDKGDAGGADIDDSTTSSTKTWSSNKIRNEIDAKPVNLSELDDVDLDSISDEQLLGYNFTTGKWNNKTINASSLKYDANTTIKSKIDEKANTADLATVATSGEYNDLSNKPQLATVATSGDYDDLINKPSIPPAQVNADWNASSGVAEILNKPTIPVVDQTLNPSSSNAISNSAVANGLNGKANALLVERKQYLNVTFDNYYKSMSDNISKSGYTPLGVVGFQSATVGVLFFRANIDFNTDTLWIGLVARDGTTVISGSVNIFVDVLYIKNS